ncbi:ATP-binding cassette domain-containing protein [Thalassobaculum sp. OXR-137]|uniref:ATP-binding cassette domain-containing protein n=1 Tax=Thalassobaculum sp. OXR-137 TaxID=3100173 RepID=UPI002AC9773E|nr:ATP-binding cassette domain-containing protein [Thalassobaculum sp. OXR-137]WPZ34622.1 ATP-binding cassette domain-containing protein [Thalassobaculum sp. OXR-137]
MTVASTAHHAPILSVASLSIAQPAGRVLLSDVDLTLNAGEIVLLAGPSGTGKSTLINMLSGAIDPREEGWQASGEIRYGNQVYDLASDRVAIGGVVFQNFALFDDLSVADNLAIARDHSDAISPTLSAAIDRLIEDIDRRQPVASASGGQRQRVAIARTLLGNHPVLFLDEPNSGLDVSSSRQLAGMLRALVDEIDIPIVIIAHHFRHLIDVADRAVVLDSNAHALVEVAVETNAIEAALTAVENGEAPTAHAVPAPPVATDTRDLAEGGPLPDATARWELGWGVRFFLRYIWELCFSPSALLFVGLGCTIVGFVTTWFVFMYLPFRDYLLPVIHSDALAGLAFSELRVLAPLMAAVLISVRNSSLITASIGHKVYSDQIKAMRNLNVPHRLYINTMVMAASGVAAVFLAAAAVSLTAWVAMMTWAHIFPDGSTYMWRDQFLQRLWPPGVSFLVGWDWILAKTVPSIVGASAIALYFGYRPKHDVLDINKAIAQSLIWGLSFVLSWQSVLTLIEFKQVSARLEATF